MMILTNDLLSEIDTSFVEPACSTSEQSSISEQELRLQAFIQNAHQITRSGKHPTDLVLQLLDRAWRAQKLLWQLRQYE